MVASKPWQLPTLTSSLTLTLETRQGTHMITIPEEGNAQSDGHLYEDTTGVGTVVADRPASWGSAK
jgi:hypothetical protein